MSQWQSAVVLENIAWTEHLYSLRIETDPIAFAAGQFTRLGLEVDGTLIARPYSFVNAPDEPVLEFYFNIVPQGPLSNRLAALRAGDSLEIASPCSGFMVLNEVPQGRDLWMLATGTAIGPFLSILSTAPLWQRFDQVVLVYAVQHLADLRYRALLDRFAVAHPDQFRWLPFISREAVDGAMPGRIPEAIRIGLLEQTLGLSFSAAHSQVLLCGNPAMVKDTMAVLTQRGLSKNLRRSPGQITVERYW